MTNELRTTVGDAHVFGSPRYEIHEGSKFKVHETEFVELESGQWFIRGENFVEKQFPVDFYLREMRDDFKMMDVESTVAAVKEWGLFADVIERDVPAGLTIHLESPLHWIFGEGEAWNRDVYEDLNQARVAAAKELNMIVPRGRSSLREWEDNYHSTLSRIVNISEIRYRARLMGSFSGFLSWYRLGEKMDEFGSDALVKLNAALTIFAPRLIAPGMIYGDQEVTIFNLAALQIATDIRDGVDIRICQNANCGREFTRQRGRAVFGEYRMTGEVKYCSHKCAKAQNMRDSRKAKRGETNNV